MYSFTILIIYKVLKPASLKQSTKNGFTILIIYKVLKHELWLVTNFKGFTILIIYKVLKHDAGYDLPPLQFYNLNNLQGSQTSNGYHRTHILGSIVIINITILQLNTYLCL